MPDPSPHAPRFTPRRPWQRMSDVEWYALLPHIHTASGPGRPLRELRQRIDGIFAMACGTAPWRELPEDFGKPDTVSRYFRRLSHAGVWHRLVQELIDLPAAHPLRALESWICRACRRARRILGLGMIVLLRRLGLHSALWAPPWLLPDPDLSEHVLRIRIPMPARFDREGIGRTIRASKLLRGLLTLAGGRLRIPAAVREAWP